MTVLSVQKHTITLGAGVFTNGADLTGSPAVSNCVPFMQTRVSTISSNNPDSMQDYAARADFNETPDPDQVRVTIAGTDTARVTVHEVSVVEFDPTYVNVYSGVASISDSDTVTVTDAFGAGPVTVDQSKAWLYFTYSTEHTHDLYYTHAIRGMIGDGDDTGTASTLAFDCVTYHGAADPVTINWYVVECKNTEWSVQTADIQLIDTVAAANSASFTGVTANKTFILGSHIGADSPSDADQPDINLIDITLTGSNDQLTGTRTTGSGQIDWHGYVVSFAGGGNEVVYRGTLNWTAAETSKTNVTITGGPVSDTADCTIHLAGHTGVMGGGNWNDTTNSSARFPDSLTAWTFTSASALTVTHSNNGNVDDDQDLTWQVIEWDVGGAPPATSRRVMVIS